MLGAAVDRTYGDDTRLDRRNHTRHQGLQAGDDLRGEDDGVFRGMRIRAVATNPVHRDVN